MWEDSKGNGKDKNENTGETSSKEDSKGNGKDKNENTGETSSREDSKGNGKDKNENTGETSSREDSSESTGEHFSTFPFPFESSFDDVSPVFSFL